MKTIGVWETLVHMGRLETRQDFGKDCRRQKAYVVEEIRSILNRHMVVNTLNSIVHDKGLLVTCGRDVDSRQQRFLRTRG